MEVYARALTIAGSDSGGGAGIQADLKTFAVHGVYGLSAVTAVTAQNTYGVVAVEELSTSIIAAQINAVVDDIGVDAVKIGMLSSYPIVETVATLLAARAFPRVVLDTVMVAKGGGKLLHDDALEALINLLLPLTLVVTPNIPEAEVLCGQPIPDISAARLAARTIHAFGPSYVVIKGGHLPGPPIDLVFDGEHFTELMGERILTSNTHGTGCTFSAAIAANLALGLAVLPAIASAKRFTAQAMSAGQPIGHGHRPLHHFFRGFSS